MHIRYSQVMQHKPLSLTQVLLCGAAIVTLSMGIRHGFGLWLQPITQAQGWGRQEFAFAMAIQNLAWGLWVFLLAWWPTSSVPTE